MATYISKHEPLVTCPFNPAHQVKRGRYQIHISKCKRSTRGEGMKRCPFSPDHLVEPYMLMQHIYTCPLNKAVNYTSPASDTDVPVMKRIVAFDGSKKTEVNENWDNNGTRRPSKQVPSTSGGNSTTQASQPQDSLENVLDGAVQDGAEPQATLETQAAQNPVMQHVSEQALQPAPLQVPDDQKETQHQELVPLGGAMMVHNDAGNDRSKESDCCVSYSSLGRGGRAPSDGSGGHQSIVHKYPPALPYIPAGATLSTAYGTVQTPFMTSIGFGHSQSVAATYAPAFPYVSTADNLGAAYGGIRHPFVMPMAGTPGTMYGTAGSPLLMPLASTTWAEEEEASSRMKLLGIGRGKKLQ